MIAATARDQNQGAGNYRRLIIFLGRPTRKSRRPHIGIFRMLDDQMLWAVLQLA
jgi:hypothetical protein